MTTPEQEAEDPTEHHYEVFSENGCVYAVWAADEAAALKAGTIHWDTSKWTAKATGKSRKLSERPTQEFRT